MRRLLNYLTDSLIPMNMYAKSNFREIDLIAQGAIKLRASEMLRFYVVSHSGALILRKITKHAMTQTVADV